MSEVFQEVEIGLIALGTFCLFWVVGYFVLRIKVKESLAYWATVVALFAPILVGSGFISITNALCPGIIGAFDPGAMNPCGHNIIFEILGGIGIPLAIFGAYLLIPGIIFLLYGAVRGLKD